MEKQILTYPMVEPKEDILENALGKKYKLFKEFYEETDKQKLIYKWNYYKDGKSWLCKILDLFNNQRKH